MRIKKHLIYKVYDPITNEYYIGKHSTYNITDNYMGSGTWIKKLLKTQMSSLKKEILCECISAEEAYQKEREFIGDNWKSDILCRNFMPGGKISAFEKEIYTLLSQDKFGADSHMMNKEFLENFKQNNKNKTGYETPFNNPEIQNNIDEIFYKKYGGRGSASDFIKNKVMTTNIEKYGIDNTLHLKQVKNARELSCVLKYGDKNPFKNNEKLQEVMLTKHGVTNMMFGENVRAKHKKIMASIDWTTRNQKSKETKLRKLLEKENGN